MGHERLSGREGNAKRYPTVEIRKRVSGPRPRGAILERYFEAQLQRSAAAGTIDDGAAADGPGNVAVSRTGNTVARVAKLRRVGEVEGFSAELHRGALADFEALEQRGVQDEQPRSADDVAAAGAERHAGPRSG